MTEAPPDAPTTRPADPQDQATRDQAAQGQAAGASVGLLRLVRQCIDHGQALIEALQRRNAPTAPPDIAWRFGTISLVLVIARLTRGLWLAEALARRLQRGAARRDAIAQGTLRPPSPAYPRRDPPASSPRPRVPRPDEAAELLNLPSAREIAARVRNRPVGAVIVEICRDLGIDGQHPLWAEVLGVITRHGGNRGELIRANLRRASEAMAAGLTPVLTPTRMATGMPPRMPTRPPTQMAAPPETTPPEPDGMVRSGPSSAWATAPP